MSRTINALSPPRGEQKLAEYCAKRGVTRSQAVLRALEAYLDKAEGGAAPYALAADLIPAKGAADNPLSRGELDEKFYECARWGGVSKQKAARAIELVSSMERWDDCRDFMQCLVR